MAPTTKLKPTVAPVKRSTVDDEEAAPVQKKPQSNVPPAKPGRAPSGIPGLDELLGGGFESASTTLVMGEAGCGKTTFLSQFLYRGAVDYNEPGVLLSFEEPQATVLRHMRSYGFAFEELEKQNLFSAISYRPHEVKKLVDEGGGLIWDTISSLGAKRLAIDSLTSYSMLFDSPYRAREADLLLFELLHKWGCTTLLSADGLDSNKLSVAMGMEYLSDGVILLHHPRHQASRYRAVEILKMRGSKHSEKICPFEFVSGEGMKVYPGESIFYEVGEEEKK